MKHIVDAEQSVYELPAEAKIPAPPVPPKPRSLLPQYTLEELAELRETERAQTEQLVETFAKVVPAKFRNLSGRKIDLWHDSGSTGVKQGILAPGADLTTNSYPGCGREFSSETRARAVTRVASSCAGAFSASSRRTILEAASGHSRKATMNEMATYLHVFDDGSGSELEYTRHAEEKTFSEAYRNRTQRHWVAFWPREVRPRAKRAPMRF